MTYSALTVPFGRICEMAPRCTLISTLGAISTVAYWSVSFAILPTMPPAVMTFVALLQGVEHRARLLRALLLGPDQQEVEDDEDRDHRQERHEIGAGEPPPAAWA
jgi:hypothetical protein